jgi:phosphatidylglycerophosphate synthase
MPRLQDILFILFAVAVAVMLAFGVRIAVIALVGAFGLGAIYLLAGMLPERGESFGRRLFTTVFLSLVLSSLVLILPGTFGPAGEKLRTPVLAIAALLPVAAAIFEIARTPRLIERALRLWSRPPGGR